MAKKKQHSVLGVPFKSSLKINTEALGFCKRLFEIQSLLRGASETPRSQAEEWVFSRGRCTVMHTACVDFNDEPCGIKFCVKKNRQYHSKYVIFASNIPRNGLWLDPSGGLEVLGGPLGPLRFSPSISDFTFALLLILNKAPVKQRTSPCNEVRSSASQLRRSLCGLGHVR